MKKKTDFAVRIGWVKKLVNILMSFHYFLTQKNHHFYNYFKMITIVNVEGRKWVTVF